MQASKEHSYISPHKVRQVRVATQDARAKLAENYQSLEKYGIHIPSRTKARIENFYMRGDVNNYTGMGMDAALTAPISAESIGTPIQFLQTWLPGVVEDVTAARKIDRLIGISTVGRWEDEEVVQQFVEVSGQPAPYTDRGNTVQTGFNNEFPRRSVVRFELGIEVGRLEAARSSAVQISADREKRRASQRGLEIIRNRVGFFGYNNGANRTYGFLNSPNLPAYVDVANGAAGFPEWDTKDFDEIKNDLLEGAQALRVQTNEAIDPSMDPIVLAIAMSGFDFLAQTTNQNSGYSVLNWIKDNYPNWRIESAPELDAANGADNVFYLYADVDADSGTDNQRTFDQIVPTKFMVLGVDQKTKTYEEAHSNATAGTFVKRPYAIVRRSGI